MGFSVRLNPCICYSQSAWFVLPCFSSSIGQSGALECALSMDRVFLSYNFPPLSAQWSIPSECITRHPDLYAGIGRIADVGRCIDGRALAPAHHRLASGWARLIAQRIRQLARRQPPKTSRPTVMASLVIRYSRSRHGTIWWSPICPASTGKASCRGRIGGAISWRLFRPMPSPAQAKDRPKWQNSVFHPAQRRWDKPSPSRCVARPCLCGWRNPPSLRNQSTCSSSTAGS